jgi:hypothetical protein
MMVTVQRSGGFAGLTRTWQVDVDQPDRFVWVISAETSPAKKAKLPEQQVTGPWRELVDRVREVSDAERTAERGAGPGAERGAGTAGPGSTAPGSQG